MNHNLICSSFLFNNMKKSTKIIIFIGCIFFAIQAGFIASVFTYLGIGFIEFVTPLSFNVEKYGGVIFTNQVGTYCIKNDFSLMMKYSKEYESDSFETYEYSYDAETDKSVILDCNNEDKTSQLSSLVTALNERHSFFNHSPIYKVNDVIFILSNMTCSEYAKTMMFYFDGSEINYVFEIYDRPLSKIKILDGFIK